MVFNSTTFRDIDGRPVGWISSVKQLEAFRSVPHISVDKGYRYVEVQFRVSGSIASASEESGSKRGLSLTGTLRPGSGVRKGIIQPDSKKIVSNMTRHAAFFYATRIMASME
jgi:hypothetical protein